jgi:hypothetical protein
MREEKVVTLGCNKETPKPFMNSSTQQSHGQPSKTTPQKAKGPNRNLMGVLHLTLLNMGEKINVGGVVGYIGKKDFPNPL